MQIRMKPLAALLLPLFASCAYADDTLGTVVVTASRAQEAKRELSANVTVIDEAEIKASTASTMADLMQQQGFFVVTTGDSSFVQIRGYGSLSMASEPENTVLTLINGRRAGSANLALIGLANVERIEIIRGPSAVQYGSSALGGVINIITKRGQEKTSASLEIGAGSDGLVREKLALGGTLGNLDYSLGAANYSRDDITTSEFGRWYHTDVKNNTLGFIDLGYTIAKNHRLGLTHYQGDVQSNLPTSGIRTSNTPSTAFSQYRKQNRTTTASYTGGTDDKVLDWSTSYTFGREDNEYKSLGYTNFIENRMFNAQAGYNGSLFSLSAGFDSLQYDSYASNAPTKLKMSDDGVYFSGKLRLLDERLILSVGGRYDQYENTAIDGATYKDQHYGGTYGIAWLPVEGFKLRANYAEGFKMPSPRQVGGAAPWYNANPGLMPEIGKTWEIGADIYWRSLAASLTYFNSTYENKIIGVAVTGMPRLYQYQNIKDAELSGVEGNIRADLGKEFGLSYKISPFVNFTWLETRKTNDSTQFITYNGNRIDTLPNTPEWMFSYGVDFEHPGYKLKSRINANTYGALLTRNWSSGGVYIKRPSGTVVNFSLDKELVEFSNNLGKLSLRAEINNLFDGKNEMYWDYPGQGRNFYLGMRYDY